MFRAAKAAIKLHTLLDLRDNIPTFIHISDGKVHEVKGFDVRACDARFGLPSWRSSLSKVFE